MIGFTSAPPPVGSGGKRATQECRQLVISRPEGTWRVGVAVENLVPELVVGDGGIEEDEAEQVHERMPYAHVADDARATRAIEPTQARRRVLSPSRMAPAVTTTHSQTNTS